MSNKTVQPFTIRPEDQEMVIGALHEYQRVLAKAAGGKGTNIYGRLIARAKVLFDEMWKNRYGIDFGASDDKENDDG